MSEVTVSLVASFDNSNGGQLSAEFDARPTGFNKGVTSFKPGDSPAFLVYKSSDVEIETIKTSIDQLPPTDAHIQSLGAGVIEIKEDIQFSNTAQGNLQKPFYNNWSYKWLGNNLGVPVPLENSVTVDSAGVGILRVTYNALFLAYRLTGVPNPLSGETSYSVLIVITGTRDDGN